MQVETSSVEPLRNDLKIKTPLTSMSEEFILRRYKVAAQDLSDHTDILVRWSNIAEVTDYDIGGVAVYCGLPLDGR